MSKKNKKVEAVAPAKRAELVLSEPYDVIAQTLRSDPNTWYLIGTGPRERLGVLSQTAYRIRCNRIAAFRTGSWETKVSSVEDPDRKNDEAIQVFARFRAASGRRKAS